MEIVCLVIPLAQGSWVTLTSASRRLLADAPTPLTVRICFGGDDPVDWPAVELAARTQIRANWLADRPGPRPSRRRRTIGRNWYDLALGLGLIVSAQGLAIPALGGLWLLGKCLLRLRRCPPRIWNRQLLDPRPAERSAHIGLARLAEVFADEPDERVAYLAAGAMAKGLALPEAESIYWPVSARPHGLRPDQLPGVWLPPAAGLDRPLLEADLSAAPTDNQPGSEDVIEGAFEPAGPTDQLSG